MSFLPEDLPGRKVLNEWQKGRPSNLYEANPWLSAWVRREIPEEEERIFRFGAIVRDPLESLVMESESRENLPTLKRYDGMGNRIEEVVFHPSYHEAGKIVYENGLVYVRERLGTNRLQTALFYLLTHLGEMGHACPVTCSTGLALALREYGSEELKREYLPKIFARKYEERYHGSQFLTEVQSGSEVGANIVSAIPDREGGVYRIYGEKWFCSVADACLFFVTARPEGAPPGMKGLSAFLVPRHLPDGRVNYFTLRRLKEKLGTRGLATGEIEFWGAVAYPIGALSEGYKIALGIVLNTSRYLNSVAACGGMMMSYLEALSFARYRVAFSHPILSYPLVQEKLAYLKASAVANLFLTFYIGEILDRMELKKATSEEEKIYRFLVNGMKYFTSIENVPRSAIEILGGNGTIETFTLLPRLYRDGIVVESWEGAHNVLCLQVYRDTLRLNLLPSVKTAFLEFLRSVTVPFEPLGRLKEMGERAFRKYEELLEGEEEGIVHCRRVLERILSSLRLGYFLYILSQKGYESLREEGKAIGELLFYQMDPSYDPVEDPSFSSRIRSVLGRDLSFAVA